ncbi:GSCOCG00006663001-RA-CDS [Cotesia congregata]|uniref:Uncharacterized protein n=1 Tax=Cotesia congregata TaxID=51543 RepID=A0A8J2MYW5_COTCN|nr:GSCOCG00006663001-RA-CDS [Cotesia congregata]CAG5106080.1 Protein of unknown function [Cotesia congregata]
MSLFKFKIKPKSSLKSDLLKVLRLYTPDMPHTTAGPIYRNGSLYWRFLSYVQELHADDPLENLSKVAKKEMLIAINSGCKYNDTYESSYDFMVTNYTEIIDINLKLLKQRKVDIILVAPEVKANLPVLQALVSHLSSFYIDELNKSFSTGTVPYATLRRRIESSFTQIVEPHPTLRDFIFSNVIKYMVSLKTDVPLYSIPILGSYHHRYTFTWLEKWSLDKSQFREPSEQQKFGSRSYKSKLNAFKLRVDKSFSKTKDFQLRRLPQSKEKENHGASTSVTSSPGQSAESSIITPNESFTSELKQLYHNHNEQSSDGNLDKNGTKDPSKIKGKKTANIRIKSSKVKDDSNAPKTSIREDISGLFVNPTIIENPRIEKTVIKKRRNTYDPSETAARQQSWKMSLLRILHQRIPSEKTWMYCPWQMCLVRLHQDIARVTEVKRKVSRAFLLLIEKYHRRPFLR